jgi:hypothetical protein
VRLELSIELIEDDPGFDRAAGPLDVEVENSRQVLRTVDDERFPDGLSGLRRAASTRQNRRSFAARDRNCPIGFFYRTGSDHADWHDLVVGCIGGIAPASEPVELNLTGQFGL